MTQDDAFHCLSDHIQVYTTEILPVQQTRATTTRQQEKYTLENYLHRKRRVNFVYTEWQNSNKHFYCSILKTERKIRTYLIAQYPWQIEIPPIMLAGKILPGSPKYLVTRLPPSENPTATTSVPGYRVTKLHIMEWKSSV